MPGPPTLLRRLDRLRRRLLRHRRLLAALAAGVGTVAFLQASAQEGPRTVEVLVAAHNLPSGHVLSEEDLATRPFLAETAPEQVVESDLVGSRLVRPAAAGETVAADDVYGAAAVSGLASVERLAPVRLADPEIVSLLEVGDRIDLVATDAEGDAAVVARDVAVFSLPEGEADSPLGGTSSYGTGAGGLVVLAVDESDVATVTSAGASAYVTYVWSDR